MGGEEGSCFQVSFKEKLQSVSLLWNQDPVLILSTLVLSVQLSVKSNIGLSLAPESSNLDHFVVSLVDWPLLHCKNHGPECIAYQQ